MKLIHRLRCWLLPYTSPTAHRELRGPINFFDRSHVVSLLFATKQKKRTHFLWASQIAHISKPIVYVLVMSRFALQRLLHRLPTIPLAHTNAFIVSTDLQLNIRLDRRIPSPF